MVQTQWRASGFGLIGLDYHAVFKMAEISDIPLTLPNMHKIQSLERAVLDRQAERND
jgi:hypothetical protein